GTAVHHLQLLHLDLDLAGREVLVVLAWETMGDLAGDGDDPFAAQLTGGGYQFGFLRLEDDLGQAVAVAQVDEKQGALIAVAIDPAVEGDVLANVSFTQLTASVRPPHFHVCGSLSSVPSVPLPV